MPLVNPYQQVRLCRKATVDLHHQGLDGIFQDDDAEKIVGNIRSINENAA